MNNMAANLVKDYAMGQVKQQFDANKGYFSFLSVEGLKVYFDITNFYVLHKLKIILFPFLLKEDQWKRGQGQQYQDVAFSAPSSDDVEEDDLFTPKNDL